MIRLNLKATHRELQRIVKAANRKEMSIGQFARSALRRILGRPVPSPKSKPPASERLQETKKQSRRTGL